MGQDEGRQDGDARGELWELTRALRLTLARHQRAGRWAAPGGAGGQAIAEASAGEERPQQPGRPERPERPEQGRPERPEAQGHARQAMSAAPVDVGDVAPSRAAPLEGEAARFDDVPLPSEDSMPRDEEPWDTGDAPAGGRVERGASARGGRGGAAQVAVLDDSFTPRRDARTLLAVRQELGDCQRCKLSRTRQKLVFGAGAEDASLVFVGEAPGADEDRTGEPFVGRAGELLDKMIEAMGWSRRSVYIANLLKCRPPGNRNPEPDEASECRPFLIAQLEVIAPRIIVALGRPAANALLGTDAPISSLRGKFHERRGVRIMPTFHPAYLLREPARKREAWADLKLVMQELERIGVRAPSRPGP